MRPPHPRNRSRSTSAFLLALLVGALSLVFVNAASATPAPGDLDPTYGTAGLGPAGTFATYGSAAIAAGPEHEVFVLEPDNATHCPVFVACEAVLHVARYDRNGVRDPTFGDAAKLEVTQGQYQTNAIAVSPDGKPVVAAIDGHTVVVARFGRDGKLDPSFGNGGVAGPLPEPRGEPPVLAVLSDGAVVVAYEANEEFKAGGPEGGREGRLIVARFQANGTLDPSFGSKGTVTVSTPQSRPDGLVLRPNGGFYIGMSHCCGSEEAPRIAVAAFLPNGSLDPSFAGGGLDYLQRPENSFLGTIASAPKGRLYVTAEQERHSSILIRLLPSGQIDTSFGNHGEVALGRPVGFSDMTVQLAVDGAGRILGVGGSGAGTHVFRLHANGTRDLTFGAGRAVTVPNPGVNVSTSGFDVQPSGRIVVIDEFGYAPAKGYRLEALRGGTSRIRCLGKRATIVGTAAAEKIEGTRHGDVIAAMAGADRVRGLAGNDRICGGKGRDSLFGGAGRDRLRQ